ncbi:NAD(P)/FAD-dependent oxidoreductase [Telluribacter sp.]|jgi:NAD(P)H-nitrite reductase large subunit|uniref:NAD(P)/FAD-dependent oxidoreductase n=1 Tax=Telluribacter sp. TaxID=1978767 RepID=UPI002E15EFE4|nr:NAD(P)/FAD-dependent oxidoreductase [Telluribacter sp.]
MKHIVILGNGISGITAARHIRMLSDHRITVISGETEHFFSRTALMYIYMGHMKYEHTKPYEDYFWPKNRIELKKAWVKQIDFEQKTLLLEGEESVGYDVLILAVGSEPNKFDWSGQDLDGVQGLYSYQDLEKLESSTTAGIRRGVIVGGGLIGVELAEMLLSRDIQVTLLVRDDGYWGSVLPAEESALVTNHIRTHGVDLRLNTELAEIKPDGTGKRVGSILTKGGEQINCEFVGLGVGVHPFIELLQETSVETDKGILINEFLETSLPDVYAIGDCAQHRQPPAGRKAIEQIWYTGRIMGETVARTICGDRTPYTPGVFFNSAKFIDIEYQTYGQITVPLEEDTDTFYWEHSNGQTALRINYLKETGAVIGFNALGLRLRHEVCDRWIKNERSIRYVLEHLKEVHFDPEFFQRHEDAIVQSYNSTHSEPVRKQEVRKSFLGRLFT